MSTSTAGYASMGCKELKSMMRNKVKVVHEDEEKVKRTIGKEEAMSARKVNRTRKNDEKKSRNRFPISDEDLKVNICDLLDVRDYLPAMAETFDKKDWSLLRRSCFSKDAKLVESGALKHEIVAICVFFLLTDVPCHVKDRVSRVLKSVSPKDPDGNYGPVHLPKNKPIDQAFIDALLMNVLCSENVEVMRQVCLTLVVLVRQCLLFAVGTSVQIRLLQLVQIFDSHEVIAAALCAIRHIRSVDQGMKERLVRAVVSDSEWLLKLTRDSHETVRENAYLTVVSIIHGKCSDELWEALKKFIPGMVEEADTSNICSIKQAVAHAISNATVGASSDRIEVLVDLGCLKALYHCLFYNDEYVVQDSLDGIENILIAGRVKGRSREENKYAKMIDGYLRGWVILLVGREDYYNDDLNRKSVAIVKKFGPRNWMQDNGYSGWL